MNTLLVVDDDTLCTRQLTGAFQKDGWVVETCNTGTAALHTLSVHSFDFILLACDLMDIDGLQLCRQFRGCGGITPIIFLGKSAHVNKELALYAGGDDFLCKPFLLSELHARMRAIQRRGPNLLSEVQSIKGLRFNSQLRTISCGDQQVRLSLLESEIVQFFLLNRNRYFSSAALLQEIWRGQEESSDAVRSTFKRLRMRLNVIGARDLISTVKGAGYVLIDEQQVSYTSPCLAPS